MDTQQQQHFSLKWNNYLSHITSAFDNLRDEDGLLDCTLSCQGKRIKAHKMLLSACSSYFLEIFKENPCQHPVIILKGVIFYDLEALIDFMYNGEVNVSQDRLASFLNTAELLQVRGLTDGVAQGQQFTESSSPSASPTTHPTPQTEDDPLKLPDEPPLTDHHHNSTHPTSAAPPHHHPPPSKRQRISVSSSRTSIDEHSLSSSASSRSPAMPCGSLNESENGGLNVVVKSEEFGGYENDEIGYGGEVECQLEDDGVGGAGVKLPSELSIMPIGGGNRLGQPSTSSAEGPPIDPSQGVTNRWQGVDAMTRFNLLTEAQKRMYKRGMKGHHECNICGKVFGHPASLSNHKAVHTGKTKCPICLEVFGSISNMRSHVTYAHIRK